MKSAATDQKDAATQTQEGLFVFSTLLPNVLFAFVQSFGYNLVFCDVLFLFFSFFGGIFNVFSLQSEKSCDSVNGKD